MYNEWIDTFNFTELGLQTNPLFVIDKLSEQVLVSSRWNTFKKKKKKILLSSL